MSAAKLARQSTSSTAGNACKRKAKDDDAGQL